MCAFKGSSISGTRFQTMQCQGMFSVTFPRLTDININNPNKINVMETVAMAINVIKLDRFKPMNVSLTKNNSHRAHQIDFLKHYLNQCFVTWASLLI